MWSSSLFEAHNTVSESCESTFSSGKNKWYQESICWSDGVLPSQGKKNAPESACFYVHIRFQPFVSGSVVVFG